jgi:hypothetical protein
MPNQWMPNQRMLKISKCWISKYRKSANSESSNVESSKTEFWMLKITWMVNSQMPHFECKKSPECQILM